MSQTEFILWVVFGISVVALIALQVRSMLATMRLGGRGARWVVAIRWFFIVALLGLFGYVVYTQVTR